MADAATAVAEAAPAKINLALHVVGRRSDGYHRIESFSVFTAFGDRIAVGPAPRDLFTVSGPFAHEIPDSAENLAVRARDVLRKAAGAAAASPALIFLEKNIPPSSGVGGGSSDAAAVLRALLRFWKLDISAEALSRIGLTLGADVPMCLHARPLIARGIGDVIEPVEKFPSLALVLVNPRVAVGTPQVFAALEKRENPPLPPLPKSPDTARLVDWLTATRNDLMAPAKNLAPAIGEVLETLNGAGAAFARMSGSGATCFGLFKDRVSAERAAGAIAKARPDWFVVATETTASAFPGEEH
ncbi:4-(cytidine 5'-diphospho)-2-C-methyl-D-erythritol kinase [Mesorhizobium sp. LHD-90]|uniref:4-(cytidine 5'-diphospho)-2-C-methyl-D-erythritol kinase n=1 Tax=Mesorhizobium sp. LHD-90 TaxID=3071414 RepID=UPI0027DEE375|nr:4-(cytidine 5'-diphospho)-2-C-methyl-D-erythritol kinase [Mesorhizobium sp. LHD-90]MDQ6436035.1 4-(cytidine 5'-diphospho)-2-C-methyl-D-erythritol kinase [Mesorhizobium sp. LHD-90]